MFEKFRVKGLPNVNIFSRCSYFQFKNKEDEDEEKHRKKKMPRGRRRGQTKEKEKHQWMYYHYWQWDWTLGCIEQRHHHSSPGSQPLFLSSLESYSYVGLTRGSRNNLWLCPEMGLSNAVSQRTCVKGPHMVPGYLDKAVGQVFHAGHQLIFNFPRTSEAPGVWATCRVWILTNLFLLTLSWPSTSRVSDESLRAH